MMSKTINQRCNLSGQGTPKQRPWCLSLLSANYDENLVYIPSVIICLQYGVFGNGWKKKKEEFLFFIPKRKLTETSGLITQM